MLKEVVAVAVALLAGVALARRRLVAAVARVVVARARHRLPPEAPQVVAVLRLRAVALVAAMALEEPRVVLVRPAAVARVVHRRGRLAPRAEQQAAAPAAARRT